jgi:nucleoside 2-deoxyribosyltransferase
VTGKKRDDVWDDPQAQAYLRRAKRELEPMIQDSAVVMSLWTGDVDPKMAIEMGYAILLGKPIVVLKLSGQDVPPTLARIADGIVEFDDMSDPDLHQRIAGEYDRVIRERGL